MTLISAEPGHFSDWLAADRIALSPGTLTARGDCFPERRIFGRYVAAQLAPLLATAAIRHLRTSALAARRAGDRWRVDLADGTSLDADVVVLAMSHPAPALPQALRGLAQAPALFADPYDTARLAELARKPRILIVGTGLTSADVVASLVRHGHQGHITALSRHGLRSRGHGVVTRKTGADFATAPARTAVALLRRIRAAVAHDAAGGESWHAVLDQVRDQGPAIWAALALPERRRLVRHLRTVWDVHRFRIAPQVEAALDQQLRAGRLEILAARLVAARETPDGIAVDYRPRGGHATLSATFDAVVVTTGPDHGAVLRSNPVFRSLAEAGLLHADPTGLGLHVADRCRVIDAAAVSSGTLLVAGPLARGDVGELMGVPEVTRHAEHVAQVVAAAIAAAPEAADGAPSPPS